MRARKVDTPAGPVTYELERKRVKNINLRVREDGSVYVSAGPRVSTAVIDAFVISKGTFIMKAIRRMQAIAAARPSRPEGGYDTKACRAAFEKALQEVYPLIAPYGVPMPQLRLREMKSCWGTCLYKKGIITLNKKLLGQPEKCIRYVAMHELCHFVHPNHSKDFYALLEKLMPDWKACKQLLNYGANSGEKMVDSHI